MSIGQEKHQSLNEGAHHGQADHHGHGGPHRVSGSLLGDLEASVNRGDVRRFVRFGVVHYERVAGPAVECEPLLWEGLD